jgi:D-lactate dehydrogenase (cytochrome)
LDGSALLLPSIDLAGRLTGWPAIARRPFAAHDPIALAGAVIYPRSKEDVIKIVKLASKYNCPIIPQCAGTSLEGWFSFLGDHGALGRPLGLTRHLSSGHTSPLGYKNNPNDTVANQKRTAGESVSMEDLKPGLAFVLDFAENMNEIIQINGELF